jgi:hypothetical protein
VPPVFKPGKASSSLGLEFPALHFDQGKLAFEKETTAGIYHASPVVQHLSKPTCHSLHAGKGYTVAHFAVVIGVVSLR